VPNDSTWLTIRLLIPSPAENTIITAEIPITIPNTVKPVLNLLALMDLMAIWIDKIIVGMF